MADFYSSSGKVVQGDFKDYYFFIFGSAGTGSDFLDKYPYIEWHSFTGRTVNVDGTGFLRTSGTTGTDLNAFLRLVPMEINKSTVSSYKRVSSSEKQLDTADMVRGSLFAGAAFGLANALSNASGKHLYAIYFKNGKKSLIEVDDDGANSLEKLLFDF